MIGKSVEQRFVGLAMVDNKGVDHRFLFSTSNVDKSMGQRFVSLPTLEKGVEQRFVSLAMVNKGLDHRFLFYNGR